MCDVEVRVGRSVYHRAIRPLLFACARLTQRVWRGQVSPEVSDHSASVEDRSADYSMIQEADWKT